MGEQSAVNGTADFCRSNEIISGISFNETKVPFSVSDRVKVLIMYLFFFGFTFSYCIKTTDILTENQNSNVFPEMLTFSIVSLYACIVSVRMQASEYEVVGRPSFTIRFDTDLENRRCSL